MSKIQLHSVSLHIGHPVLSNHFEIHPPAGMSAILRLTLSAAAAWAATVPHTTRRPGVPPGHSVRKNSKACM